MTATTPGREVDASVIRTLTKSYKGLVKANENSVRAAWRFGQCIDSFTDRYTQLQLADSMDLSVGTLHRYLRLYKAYQRPELAVAASAQLETYNIDLITQLQWRLGPVQHARPLAGRHFRYTCLSCQRRGDRPDIHREEYDPDAEPAGEAELTPAELDLV